MPMPAKARSRGVTDPRGGAAGGTIWTGTSRAEGVAVGAGAADEAGPAGGTAGGTTGVATGYAGPPGAGARTAAGAGGAAGKGSPSASMVVSSQVRYDFILTSVSGGGSAAWVTKRRRA